MNNIDEVPLMGKCDALHHFIMFILDRLTFLFEFFMLLSWLKLPN